MRPGLTEARCESGPRSIGFVGLSLFTDRRRNDFTLDLSSFHWCREGAYCWGSGRPLFPFFPGGSSRGWLFILVATFVTFCSGPALFVDGEVRGTPVPSIGLIHHFQHLVIPLCPVGIVLPLQPLSLAKFQDAFFLTRRQLRNISLRDELHGSGPGHLLLPKNYEIVSCNPDQSRQAYPEIGIWYTYGRFGTLRAENGP